MKNIDPKNIASKFAKNLGWIFLAAFGFLLALEILEINTSAQIILNANREPAGIVKEKGVRINFDSYNQVVKRIQEADAFQPAGGNIQNPFHPPQTGQ